MTTGARGEAILQDEDGEVRLLFTNRVLFEIEQKSGKSAYKLFAQIPELTYAETVLLIGAGMRGAGQGAMGKEATAKAWEILGRFGFVKIQLALSEALTSLFSIGIESIQKEEADGPPDVA